MQAFCAFFILNAFFAHWQSAKLPSRNDVVTFSIERFEMAKAFMAIEGKRLRGEKPVSEKEKGILSAMMQLVFLILVFFFLPFSK